MLLDFIPLLINPLTTNLYFGKEKGRYFSFLNDVGVRRRIREFHVYYFCSLTSHFGRKNPYLLIEKTISASTSFNTKI